MTPKPTLPPQTLDSVIQLKSTICRYQELLDQALSFLWQDNPSVAARIEEKLERLETKP
jgi:hypothetical protein